MRWESLLAPCSPAAALLNLRFLDIASLLSLRVRSAGKKIVAVHKKTGEQFVDAKARDVLKLSKSGAVKIGVRFGAPLEIDFIERFRSLACLLCRLPVFRLAAARVPRHPAFVLAAVGLSLANRCSASLLVCPKQRRGERLRESERVSENTEKQSPKKPLETLQRAENKLLQTAHRNTGANSIQCC